jgi:hypothetical protein
MRFAIDAVFVSGENGENQQVVAIRGPADDLVPLVAAPQPYSELPTDGGQAGTRLGDTLVLETATAPVTARPGGRGRPDS